MISFHRVSRGTTSKRQEKALKRQIGTNPNQLTAYLELSQLYQDQGRFKDAETILKSALRVPLELAEWVEASNRLGWALLNQEKYDAALAIASSVITTASGDVNLAETHYLMGCCYGEKWDPEAESSIYEKYHSACISNLEQALTEAKALGDHDLQAYILAYLASVKEVGGCPERAIELVQDALSLPDLKPHTLRACHARLGCLYDDYRQDYDKAREHFQQAVEQEEKEKSNELSWIYRRLAIVHWLLDDVPAAFASADKALGMVDMSDPAIGRTRKADAYRLIGDLNFQSDQFDAAVKCYQEYLKLEKKDLEGRARVQMDLGYTLVGKEDYRQAKKYLNAALRSGFIPEKRGYLLGRLGQAAYQLKDFKQAVQHYNQAIEHLKADDHEQAMVYWWLGRAYFHLKQYREAARSYREALKLVAPDDPVRSKLLKDLVRADEGIDWSK